MALITSIASLNVEPGPVEFVLRHGVRRNQTYGRKRVSTRLQADKPHKKRRNNAGCSSFEGGAAHIPTGLSGLKGLRCLPPRMGRQTQSTPAGTHPSTGQVQPDGGNVFVSILAAHIRTEFRPELPSQPSRLLLERLRWETSNSLYCWRSCVVQPALLQHAMAGVVRDANTRHQVAGGNAAGVPNWSPGPRTGGPSSQDAVVQRQWCGQCGWALT